MLLLAHKSPIAGEQASNLNVQRATHKKHKKSLKEKLESFLKRKSQVSGVPGEGGERIIHINNVELNDQQHFLHNRVFTAKYTVFTFLPKFLYEEFSKYANLFFLFISCIQVYCCYSDYLSFSLHL